MLVGTASLCTDCKKVVEFHLNHKEDIEGRNSWDVWQAWASAKYAEKTTEELLLEDEYARIGYEYAFLSKTLNKANCSDKISSIFTEIQLKNKYSWSMHMACPDCWGDISCLEIKNKLGKVKASCGNIIPYVTARQNRMAAWQVYLLHNISHILPFRRHGGYLHRYYIIGPDELYAIKVMEGKDFDIIAKGESLFPEVVEIELGKYMVSCCYWSDWRGLVRETYTICIDNSGNINIETIESTNLYESNMGCRF